MTYARRPLDEEFPIKRTTAYFNNASYTPMSSSAIEAISLAITSYSTHGPSDEHYRNMKHGADSCKLKLSRLIGSSPESIVFTESATQAINFVANGLKLSKGDVIVTPGGKTEHPSNLLPWEYYAKIRGVEVKSIPTDHLGFPNLNELENSLKETGGKKLLAMSHIPYNLGTVLPVEEISKLVHERDALFFLDASQSVGNVELDAQKIGCDFLAGTAAKWLCGPLGLGFFQCTLEALEMLEPLNFGAAAATPDGKYEQLKTHAKLQEGFRNWAYTYGLDAAIDLWSSYGLETIREKNLKLADIIISEVTKMGESFEFLGTSENDKRTSIIPLESRGRKASSSEIAARLEKKGIIIAEREIRERKILRISPHYYNDEEEVKRLILALKETAQ